MTPAKRFDEIELIGTGRSPTASVPDEKGTPPPDSHAPLWRRALALGLDLSLLGALVLTLGPLLPTGIDLRAALAIAGFIAVFSLCYFTCGWMVWGRTLGGAVANVRVVTDDHLGVTFRRSFLRWTGLVISLATAGLGFVPALFPGHRSLADRISHTHVAQ
ncbi:MAG: RDD family protein [Acidobacteria bacterium]|nr:RDD family protein [Acidobacteriota bacterium]